MSLRRIRRKTSFIISLLRYWGLKGQVAEVLESGEGNNASSPVTSSQNGLECMIINPYSELTFTKALTLISYWHIVLLVISVPFRVVRGRRPR